MVGNVNDPENASVMSLVSNRWYGIIDPMIKELLPRLSLLVLKTSINATVLLIIIDTFI